MADVMQTKPPGWSDDQWGQYQTAMAQAAQQNAINSKQPVQPGYVGTTDASGNLLPGFGADASADLANPADLNLVRDRATGTAASPWATLARDQLNTDTQNQMDSADAQGAQGVASARDNLAQYGGLSEGARERVAAGGARATALNKNAIARNQITQSTNIGMQDEGERAKLLGQLPGMDQQAAAAKTALDEFNVGQKTANNQNQNTFNQGQYEQQMKAWAANKQADATANSGKK